MSHLSFEVFSKRHRILLQLLNICLDILLAVKDIFERTMRNYVVLKQHMKLVRHKNDHIYLNMEWSQALEWSHGMEWSLEWGLVAQMVYHG